MSKTFKKLKTYLLVVICFFVMVGTYNAVVINSNSSLLGSDFKMLKRLDESSGKIIEGRKIAGISKWTKLTSDHTYKAQAEATQLKIEVPELASTTPNTSVVQEELNLELVEVVNVRKWAMGLPSSEYSGHLSTEKGKIGTLTVALPSGEGISLSSAEISGNVFEYELSGTVHHAMLYQVDAQSYMVTLTNGPLEGTRLRFSKTSLATQEQETHQVLSDSHNIEVGTFGAAEPVSLEPANDSVVQSETVLTDQLLQLEAQTFNMDQG
ncbi:MAG TPA: hypothetical protein VNJ01_14485 [Bacteriovoracaceae bacterium]|nr:hypothetical protein [Bacteriovoracaceae bacterium]